MNTPAQSLGFNRENARVQGNPVPSPSHIAPVQPPVRGPGMKHWHFGMLFLVIPFGAIGLIVYLLRGVSPSILRQEFGTLGIVACALLYVGAFLRQVFRALAEDAKQAAVSNHLETELPTLPLSQRDTKTAPSGNPIQGYEPVEGRT
jgi:hypothetical protein